MSSGTACWVENLPVEITVCDGCGALIEMNACGGQLFAADGGRDLLGSDALACHPEASRRMFAAMLRSQDTHVYFNTEKGEKRFFYQSPWYLDGWFSGYVEISFEVPGDIPHHIME